jgi:hypothetical protein
MSTKPLKKAEPVSQETELANIVHNINEWYPMCKMAFSNFIGYRFMIGVSLLRAKELIPSAKPGPKLLPKPGEKMSKKELDAYNEAQEGFTVWKRKNFPAIPNSTLHDYKCYAERVLTSDPDMATLDLTTLPESKRGEVYAKLKAAVTGKDVTACLRAMNEIPDATPPGWDRGGRRPKKLVIDMKDKDTSTAFWTDMLQKMKDEGINAKSWQIIDKPLQSKLLDTMIQFNNLIRAHFKGE